MKYACPLLLILLWCLRPLQADPVIIDFESLSAGDMVTNQFAGMTFQNAEVLTAGYSLDESEFPPHSGSNVVFDAGAPITIDFTAPVLSFGGFFTYATTLTLDAYDPASNLVASAVSAFTNNMALSGDSGSSPNEFLEVTFASGISSVTITGDPAGGSFVLDDATITALGSAGNQVPESPGGFLFLVALIALAVARRRLRFTCVEDRQW